MPALDLIAQTKAAIAKITEPNLSISAVDISNCDREPIHIPAAIQPHGVLLALSETDWTIVQVSQNTSDSLGQAPEDLLGHSLVDLLGETQLQTLEKCLAAEFEAVNPLRFEIEVAGDVRFFVGIGHRSEGAVVLELEPLETETAQNAVSFFDFYSLVKQPVSRLQQTQTLNELCQTTVEVVKQVSGFDRVMVYKFDTDGSGRIGLVLQKADELSQLNTELERSNVELDAFAYIASHDLKEPLRGIHNYSSFLIEDYGEQLGEDGSSKLQTLMRLTQRMEDLINSLLHYSQLGRSELSIAPVDLDDLLTEVIDVIKISKPERVSFRVPRSLPTLTCDRTQVMELFTNLISNGIKYNNRDPKWIEVGYLDPDEATQQRIWPPSIENPLDRLVFYVRDNGIGIRAKHLDNVFRIFKRLHPPSRFGGGTGAGLTITKKIVERHGGQIWIDSVYGEGTTFYLTLEG